MMDGQKIGEQSDQTDERESEMNSIAKIVDCKGQFINILRAAFEHTDPKSTKRLTN